MRFKASKPVWVGLLGSLVGMYGANVSRSMCYYAADRASCLENYELPRYLLEMGIGFIVFYVCGAVIGLIYRTIFSKIKSSRNTSPKENHESKNSDR